MGCTSRDTSNRPLQHVERAEKVELGVYTAKDTGCHGKSLVIKYLDYADYNNIWIIPMSHALIYGAVKLVWRLRLTGPSKGVPAAWCYLPKINRQIMADRASHLTMTRDFGRSYRDIVDKHKQWTMEEWIHFVESWSPYILADLPKCGGPILPDPRLRQMWTLLREATLHYVSATPGNGTLEEQQAAHDKLQQYAKLVEQHFGIRTCTYNLHLLVCRAADQGRV
ncbi:hypothetical protein COCOBI_19-1870 [Coccomyxa sp. Obi]|nr:hypothetical protein COCOBI_19-1870 [Coccomyxa sp. Obi]